MNDAASNLEWLASHPKTEIFNDGIYVWLKIQTEEPTWIYTGKCTSIHQAVEVAKMSKHVQKNEKYTKKK